MVKDKDRDMKYGVSVVVSMTPSIVKNIEDGPTIEYPFLSASFYSHGLLLFSDIEEYSENFVSPAIITKKQEILFIPATMKEQLKLLCIGKNISVVSREDNWSFVSKPFLDTEFTEDTKEICYVRQGLQRMDEGKRSFHSAGLLGKLLF